MKQGFLQALGVTLYCSLIGTFLWNAEKFFGRKDTFFTPITFLTLFSTSALICAVIVFYKPYRLFFSGKKKEAADTVIFTAVWLAVFLVALFSILILNR